MPVFLLYHKGAQSTQAGWELGNYHTLLLHQHVYGECERLDPRRRLTFGFSHLISRINCGSCKTNGIRSAAQLLVIWVAI
jgi:hypothetical protein